MAGRSDAPGAMGWLKEEYDPKDYYYKPETKLEAKVSVNLRKEYPLFWAKPYDQGDIGSCVANATAAAFWFASKMQEREPLEPSRLFIYWNARTAVKNRNENDDGQKTDDSDGKDNKDQLDGKDKKEGFLAVTDGGCFIRNAMKSLAKYGVCAETTWPYYETKVGRYPPKYAYTDAQDHCILRYFRLDPDRPNSEKTEMTSQQKAEDGEKVLWRLRKCLSEGSPVVFGFNFYYPYHKKGQGNNQWLPASVDGIWQLKPLPGPTDTGPAGNFGAHAVLAIGYDDASQRVLCQNSWGSGDEGWKSKGGLFWMGYEYITDFEATNDFWMLKLDGENPGMKNAERKDADEVPRTQSLRSLRARL